MDDIDQAALDAAEAIMRGPKHINPVREKARIQLIIIDAMKQWNTRHTPEGWQLVPVTITPEMLEASYSVKTIQSESGWQLRPTAQDGYTAMLAAAPKWGGE